MDIIKILNEANPNLVIFLLSTLIAFISWIIKSIIEKPINDSKSTFTKYFDKRIEILTEVKTRLNFIAYFPNEEESLKYKDELQTIIMTQSKAAYLSKETYDKVLRISIDETTDENLLLGTIKLIDEELYLQISKIQDEIKFYRRFSNFNPLKKLAGMAYLSLQYVITLVITILLITFIITILFYGNAWTKGLVIIGALLTLYIIDRWLKR